MAAARVDYSVLALAQRTFRVERLRGEGLSFFLRNKLEPANVAAAAVLPPVPGFANPPLRSDPVQGPPSEGDPWRLDVRTLSIGHFDEIWIDAFHYRGVARLEGGFFLRPGLLARIGPARIDVASGAVQIGKTPAKASVAGTIAAAFEPWEPPKVQGSEVWQKVSGRGDARRPLRAAQFLQHLVRSAAGTRLEDGAGTAAIAGTIERGVARGEIHAAVRDGSVRLQKLCAATPTCGSPSRNGISCPGPSKSREAGSPCRTSAPPARTSRGAGGAVSTFVPERSARTTRANPTPPPGTHRPLLALLAVDLPAWTRGLLSLDNFSGTASVSLGPSLTRVRGLDAKGGSFHIQGRYLRDAGSREGAFLIELGILSVGLEIQPDRTRVHLLAARKWFAAGRDAAGEVAMVTPIPATSSRP